MRTTFISVNRNVQQNLSRRYTDMVNLQEQLATGKRLRKPSDDPVDVANSIKLRSKINQLAQSKRNIEDGLAIMGYASSAMSSMTDLLHRARELAVQASNDTNIDRDRRYMQQEVDQIFRQAMTIINTQFKGNYIFNGTNTKTAPYNVEQSRATLNDYNARTMATFGHEFDIIKRSSIDHDVEDRLYLEYGVTSLRVGDKVQLTWSSGAVPPDPEVNGRPLTHITEASFPLETYWVHSPGDPTATPPIPAGNFMFERGVDYEVDFRSGEIHILSEDFARALSAVSHTDRIDHTAIVHHDRTGTNLIVDGGTGEPLNVYSYPVDTHGPTATPPGPIIPVYDDNHTSRYPRGLEYHVSDTFQLVEGALNKYGRILNDGTPGSLDVNNVFPGSMVITIGGKEYKEGYGEYQGDYYDEDGVLQPGKNKFDFSVNYETGEITIYNMELMRDMRPQWLDGPDQTIDPLDLTVPENMYVHGQFGISFDYITRGTDAYGERITSQGDIWRSIEEGIATPINLGADAMLTDRKTGYEMVGVLLRYSQALFKDDRDGIQQALDELTAMYDATLESQSDMGARIYRYELTHSRNREQDVEVRSQNSALEDADLAEVISRLLLAENVYQAALQAAMRVIQPSLANYM